VSGAKIVSVVGLAVTIVGALVLAWRDLRPRRTPWDQAAVGNPRREAWVGFPLIALGSGLQIVGVASG
jgi:propanediol dehydratase large subunit